MNYEELVKALRHCADRNRMDCSGCEYEPDYPCRGKLIMDAAAAIEALDRLLDQNTQRCEALRKQLREAHESYERHLNDLEAEVKRLELDNEDYEHEHRRLKGEIEALQAQLPKRGEWVEENRRPRSSQFVCSECHRTAYDPQPTRDKAWRKRCRYAYCPNCGARMDGGKDDLR